MGGDLTGSCYDNWALEKHICRRLPQGVEDHIKSASGLFVLRHLHQPVSLPFDSCTDTCHPSFLSPRLPSKTVLRVPIRKRTTPGAARRKGKRMTKRKSPTGISAGLRGTEQACYGGTWLIQTVHTGNDETSEASATGQVPFRWRLLHTLRKAGGLWSAASWPAVEPIPARPTCVYYHLFFLLFDIGSRVGISLFFVVVRGEDADLGSGSIRRG
jgi:hypothetical protein